MMSRDFFGSPFLLVGGSVCGMVWWSSIDDEAWRGKPAGAGPLSMGLRRQHLREMKAFRDIAYRGLPGKHF